MSRDVLVTTSGAIHYQPSDFVGRLKLNAARDTMYKGRWDTGVTTANSTVIMVADCHLRREARTTLRTFPADIHAATRMAIPAAIMSALIPATVAKL